MAIHSVLVSGSSRGIGLGLDLHAINDKRLHIVELDVSCDKSIEEAVDSIVGDKGLTILVNNAAILTGYDFFSKPDRKMINELMNVNTTGAVIMMQMFYPLIKRAADLVPGDEFSSSRAAIVQISSDLGSISIPKKSFTGRVKVLDYCMSKSALNQASRIIAHDVETDHILVTAVHPGWVQ
ncbi:hypothetical protein WR25_16303 [Diploscapter pachys]|uniref:C-factor n=1 Tax=Diploscapter pachys TaxID=2018661 RepID=A0A2A2KIU3_9BILA|nr:hypothetical protein WR25_16303 [Diploscapter pachys]